MVSGRERFAKRHLRQFLHFAEPCCRQDLLIWFPKSFLSIVKKALVRRRRCGGMVSVQYHEDVYACCSVNSYVNQILSLPSSFWNTNSSTINRWWFWWHPKGFHNWIRYNLCTFQKFIVSGHHRAFFDKMFRFSPLLHLNSWLQWKSSR
jgi:hypothetical protein